MRSIALVLLAILSGCAAQAAAPGASINLNALVHAHPLYGTLAQYDRQIAGLRATLHLPEFSRKTQAFTNASHATAQTLTRSANRAKDIAAFPTPDVSELRQNASLNAPTESRVRSDMQHTYTTQASQLHTAAAQAMDRYRTQLLRQQQTALADYERSMQARVQQAYVSRRQQLYEKESALELDLAKAHAGQRLTIRAKLQTLQLDDERRRRLDAQMQALQAHDDAIVAKQHRRDQAQLDVLLSSLQARANADIARMRSTLEQRTQANLAERQRVLAAQNAQHATLNLGQSAQPSRRANDTNAALDSLLAAQPADPQTFLRARDDLAQQFTAVRQADDTATQSTWQQLAALNQARAQLYTDIVSQVMKEAHAVANSRGLAHVYTSASSPPGTVDITGDVRTQLLALTR
jgi:hypothetical protein